MTLLSIAQKCAERLQIDIPTAVIGSTDKNVVLLRAMIQQSVESLQREWTWPELTRQYNFTIRQDVSSYPLPTDFDRFQTETLWNFTQKWPLIGPLTPRDWQTYKSGLVTTVPRQRYRIKGWGANQFFIDPAPGAQEDSQKLVFEYISNVAIRPKTWVASTAKTLNEYRSYNGNVYKCTTAGTSSTQAPTVLNGVGLDNRCEWTYIPFWSSSVVYYVNDLVAHASKVYKCTVSGASGATGPTHTSGSAVDPITGVLTWEWVSTPTAWVAGTGYEAGDYTANTSALYLCTADGISGMVGPNWSLSVQIDGSAEWTIQSDYQTFTSDDDEVILDNKLVEDDTLWRFKKERGLEFESDKDEVERSKEVVRGRLQNAGVLTINSWRSDTWMIGPWSYPDSNYGI